MALTFTDANFHEEVDVYKRQEQIVAEQSLIPKERLRLREKRLPEV